MSGESIRSHQQCSACGERWSIIDPRTSCGGCGGLLDVLHSVPSQTAEKLHDTFNHRAAGLIGGKTPGDVSGVWRYRELVYNEAFRGAVTFPEGNTPLVERGAVSRWVGAQRLRIKHEGMNPSGSFKDRGMSVAITQAVRVGASAVACASTGNTSSSLAAYAGIAGIPAVVLVPLGKVAPGKLAQTMAYGAHVLLVRGDFDDCLRLAREAADRLGVYLANSVNPFRIEGQKTIVFELLQQLEWNVPDWITLPAGNLGNAAAFGKALREARELGLIGKTPRLLLVQASGAAPFARSFERDFAVRERVRAETIATAIRIGDPASYNRAVLSIRQTNGLVTDVTDSDILEAKSIIDESGVGCEPASAAAAAGLRKLIGQGRIQPDEEIVTVLTGHLLKSGERASELLPQTPGTTPGQEGRMHEVDATLVAIERALRQLR